MTADERKTKSGGPLLRLLEKYGFERVTFVLILLSVGAFALRFTYGARALVLLYITRVDIANAGDISVWRGFLERLDEIHQVLPEVRRGEVWRLITPVFLHLNFLHLFFNLLWLRALGGMIETHRSRLLLIILVLALGVACNLADYFVMGGILAGMSGVVYGLAGYIGIRGKLDPRTGLSLHFTTVAMMFIWFLVCFVGMGVPGANIVTLSHVTGLLMGMAWGGLAHLAVSLRKRVPQKQGGK